MKVTGPSSQLAALVIILASPAATGAQAISVRVVTEPGARPVVGALVYLVPDTSTDIRRTLTDGEGRARFVDPTPGSYRLRAEMVGMATVETEVFVARAGRSVHREIGMSPRPIVLEGLAVDADERCRLDPERGLTTARVWEEARKALAATVFADEQRLYRYRTLLYERELDLDMRVVRRSERTEREARMRTPFRSLPAGQLIDQGFARSAGADDYYYAPDARVLLSGLFLDTHCFRVRLGGETEETVGLVGLDFEPAPGRRDVVEVSGTLWLSPRSSELQWLEYRYVNLDPDVQSDEIGGRVEFEPMPRGGWIVNEWWIRMPAIALQPSVRGGFREYVGGYSESGGVVLEAEWAGRAGERVVLGGIEGVVRDSAGNVLEGVRVDVIGTGHRALSDSLGRYRISDMVAGSYRLRFIHPRLQAYGHLPAPVVQAVFNGQTSRLDHRMPSAGSVLADACAAVPTLGPDWSDLPPQARGEGILVGWVLDAASRAPLPGATVRALTYRYEAAPGQTRARGGGAAVSLDGVNLLENAPVIHEGMFGFETTADERGFYRICRIPEREWVTVTGTYEGTEAPGDTVRIMEDGGIREHIVIIRRRPR